MIRYALNCDRGHAFESWFKNSAAYDRQIARGLVTCAVCGSTKIEKAMMAPSLAKRPSDPAPAPAKPQDRTPVAMLGEPEREIRSKLKELRDQLVKNADHVGDKFPEEARRMHYGEIEHRSIYGEASPDDAAALIEEGIEFHPLPNLPDEWN